MFASYTIWQKKNFFIIISVLMGTLLGVLTLVGAGFPKPISGVFFVALIAIFVTIISGDPKRFLLFFLILDISLNIDINLGNNPAISDDPNGWNISIANISLVILYLLWFAELLSKKKKNKFKFYPEMSIPMLGLIGTGLLSFMNTTSVLFSSYEILQLFELFLMFLYVANHIHEEKDIKLILYALFVGIILQALLVVLQFFTKTQYDFLLKVNAYTDPLFRPSGSFGHANGVAGYLAPLLAICISLYLSKIKIVRPWFVLLTLMLGAVALASTLSRGGWISFIIAVWIMFVVNLHYQWLKIPPNLVLISIIGLLIVSVAFGASIVYRTSSDFEPILSRIPLMTIAFNMIKAQPLFGIGVNTFAQQLPNYTQGIPPGTWLYVVHSKYLIIWAEDGIFGLFFFVWFLVSIFRKGIKLVRNNNPFYSPLALGITAGLAGFSIHMFGDTFQTRGLVYTLWLLAALLVGVETLSRKRAP